MGLAREEDTSRRVVAFPVLLILTVLAGTGCSHEATELVDVMDSVGFQANLSVFSLISANEFIHTVSVERTFHPIESGFDPYLDAEVYMTSGDNRRRLRKQSGLTNLYWVSQFELRVIPGRRVYLEVIWDPNLYEREGVEKDTTEAAEKLPIHRATSSTIPPGSFRIEQPRTGFDTTGVAEFPVRWTTSPFAYGYLVFAMNSKITLKRTYDAVTRDTSFVIPYLFNTPGGYDIEVWAVDENYYNYYLARPNDPFVPVEDLVDGGYGVFGAFQKARIRVDILDDPVLLGGE
jgi:hypothetical protein